MLPAVPIIPNKPKFDLSQTPMLYAEALGALGVVEQPKGKAGWVSDKDDELTHFSMAKDSYGLLAHNHKAGKKFSNLKVGDKIYMNPSSKMGERTVKEIKQYQALSPNDVYSAFIDLATNQTKTADEVFKEVYGKDKRTVLQTCISKDGNNEWGRMFIIAE